MPDETKKAKLSAKEQLELCALLGIGYNPQRCCDIFKEKKNIELSAQNVYQNYLRDPRWKKIIGRLAREAERKVLAHPLAKKINRLNMLLDAINEGFTWRLDKINYFEGQELSRIQKRNLGQIAALVREARAEIEGDSALIDQSKHYHLTKIYLPEQSPVTGGIRPEVKSGLAAAT